MLRRLFCFVLPLCLLVVAIGHILSLSLSDPNGANAEFALKTVFAANNSLTWRAPLDETRLLYPFGQTASLGASYRAAGISARLINLIVADPFHALGIVVATALLLWMLALSAIAGTSKRSPLFMAGLGIVFFAAVLRFGTPTLFFIGLPAWGVAFAKSGPNHKRSLVLGLLTFLSAHTSPELFVLMLLVTAYYGWKVGQRRSGRLVDLVLIALGPLAARSELYSWIFSSRLTQTDFSFDVTTVIAAIAALLYAASPPLLFRTPKTRLLASAPAVLGALILIVIVQMTHNDSIRSSRMFAALDREENNVPIAVIAPTLARARQLLFGLESSDNVADGVRRVISSPMLPRPALFSELHSRLESFPSKDALNALEQYPSIGYVVLDIQGRPIRDISNTLRSLRRSVTPIARDHDKRVLLKLHPTIDANNQILYLPPAPRARYIEFYVKLTETPDATTQTLQLELGPNRLENVSITASKRWRKVRMELPESTSAILPHQIRMRKADAQVPGHFLIRRFRLYERWEVPDAI